MTAICVSILTRNARLGQRTLPSRLCSGTAVVWMKIAVVRRISPVIPFDSSSLTLRVTWGSLDRAVGAYIEADDFRVVAQEEHSVGECRGLARGVNHLSPPDFLKLLG